MDEAEPKLVEVPHLGEAYGAFRETARWDVSCDGDHIGQVWKAVRHDGVVCWMQLPAAIGHSMPCSSVIGGYSRTAKKGAVTDLLWWHRNGKLSVRDGEWTIHCFKDVTVPAGTERSYLALRADNPGKWLHATHNETVKPYRGAMGGVGWHVTAHRGQRMVCVHEAERVEEALVLALSRASATPSSEEAARYSHLGLPVERHYPSAAAAAPPGP